VSKSMLILMNLNHQYHLLKNNYYQLLFQEGFFYSKNLTLKKTPFFSIID